MAGLKTGQFISMLQWDVAIVQTIKQPGCNMRSLIRIITSVPSLQSRYPQLSTKEINNGF
jgi:hypothetical protein